MPAKRTERCAVARGEPDGGHVAQHLSNIEMASRRLCPPYGSILEGQPLNVADKRTSSMIPAVKAKLLEGKRGLIVGIANENSIAWGCAKAFRAFGAEVAVTYLNDKAKKYVEPLARECAAT